MNDETKSPVTTQPEEAINKKFFQELVEAKLPTEKIHQKIGDVDKDWKEDRVEEILFQSDQEKLIAYKNLEVQDLPADWKNQLARLKQLEINQVDYNQIKDDLAGWTDAFKQQKPQEVQKKISELEEKQSKVSEELNTWTTTFIDQTADKVESDRIDLVEKLQLAEKQTKIKTEQLEKELSDWKQTLGNEELQKVKEEWEMLKKRPMLALTEKEFFDDYARRKPLTVSEKESEELTQAKTQAEEYQKENKNLWRTISQFLAQERTKRYVVADPITADQADQLIIKLLDKTVSEWSDYLENGSSIENSKLVFTLQDEDSKTQAQQILTWIEEAKQTQDYQQLFEKWNGGSEYNSKYDFDGGLYLLKKYLEVKE